MYGLLLYLNHHPSLFSPGLFTRMDTQKMSVGSTERSSTATQSSPLWPSSKPWPTSRLTMRSLPERYVFKIQNEIWDMSEMILVMQKCYDFAAVFINHWKLLSFRLLNFAQCTCCNIINVKYTLKCRQRVEVLQCSHVILTLPFKVILNLQDSIVQLSFSDIILTNRYQNFPSLPSS